MVLTNVANIVIDPNVFNAWMILFINLLERPVPVEGQPLDSDIRKSWGWWKVKKWTIHILNRLYTRSVFNKAQFYLSNHSINLPFCLLITDLVIDPGMALAWSPRSLHRQSTLALHRRAGGGGVVIPGCWYLLGRVEAQIVAALEKLSSISAWG